MLANLINTAFKCSIANEWGAVEKLSYIFEHLPEANSLNLIYGIAGVGFLYLMKYLKKKVR